MEPDSKDELEIHRRAKEVHNQLLLRMQDLRSLLERRQTMDKGDNPEEQEISRALAKADVVLQRMLDDLSMWEIYE